MTKIPIIVMTKDEGLYLDRCVKSILATVKTNCEIYIVDNSSKTKEQKDILAELGKLKNVNVIYNKKNLWVLGLNKTIAKIKKYHNSRYFFLTDGDIDFSSVDLEGCWLEFLIEKMERNVSIGKIGFSLSWSYLESEPELANILQQEQSLYNDAKKINEFYVSPVDTTATLFRTDWSIEKSSFFYPDHMRYLKPELYSCRTPKNIVVEHLGWQSYGKNKVTKSLINEKVLCFTLVGGYIKNEILSQSSTRLQFFHKVAGKCIFKFWAIRRFIKALTYCFYKCKTGFNGHHM